MKICEGNHFAGVKVWVKRFSLTETESLLLQKRRRARGSEEEHEFASQREARTAELTESGSLMDTCSEKRTLGGLVRRRAFLAALMKADLGD